MTNDQIKIINSKIQLKYIVEITASKKNLTVDDALSNDKRRDSRSLFSQVQT